MSQHLGPHDVETAESAIAGREGVRPADHPTVDPPERGGDRESTTGQDRMPMGPSWWRRRAWTLVASGVTAAVIGVAAVVFVLRPGGGSGHAAALPLAVPPPAVTVGSANFDESALLGEVYAQALEAKGYRVTRRFNLGERETYYEQVKSGQIDVIPEYTGALAVALDPSSKAATAAQVNAVLARKLPPQLEMLNSAPAEDKDTVTVTRRTANWYGLHTIADLKPVAGDIVMGGSPEFQTRHQGLVGLRGTYGLNFRNYQPFATNDRATVIKQLVDDRIQAANLFATEPAIGENGLVVLADPQAPVQRPEHHAPDLPVVPEHHRPRRPQRGLVPLAADELLVIDQEVAQVVAVLANLLQQRHHPGDPATSALYRTPWFSATLLTAPHPLEGAAVAVERSDTSDEDAEKVTERQAVERRMHPDRPGAEPPGLSRADSRTAAKTANEKTTQATADAMGGADTSQSPIETSSGRDSNLVRTEKDDERDAADDIGEEQPDRPDEEETPRSGWDALGVADEPRRPGVEDIHLTDDRRSHILDGEPGGRGGHRHGTGIPRKTEFPADWDDDTTVGHIVDVARRPDGVEMQDNGRWIVRGERDGVEMDVIVEPGGRIVTAYPLPGGRGVVENPRRRTDG